MSIVRAKFQCNSIEQFADSKRVNLSAYCSNKGENADFTRYTPSGELHISIMNDAPAAGFFVPGVCYYLSFEEAPEQ